MRADHRTRLTRRVMFRSRSKVVPLALALFALSLSAVFVSYADGVKPAPDAPAVSTTSPAAAPAPAGGPSAATSKKPAKSAKAEADSLTRLEAAVKRDSTNAKSTYRLGIAYLDRDRPAEAARMFQLATKSKPDYVEAWVNLGAALDAEGHGAEARTSYRQALALRKGDEIAMCRLASSFYAVGFRDSAMDLLRDQIKANPNSSCAYFTLGVAFADAGMFRDAIKAWQQVVTN